MKQTNPMIGPLEENDNAISQVHYRAQELMA